MDACPLCTSETEQSMYTSFGPKRLFRHCCACDLIFADTGILPGPAEEKQRYDQHNNSIDDPGFRAFLAPFVTAVEDNAAQKCRGLDYGSGPEPVLAELLKRRGFDVALYDPFFVSQQDNAAAMGGQYDFITCIETAEHFHRPAVEFARLSRVLRPGGVLIVGTLLHPGCEKFSAWHYHNDFTHVVFYSGRTMQFIADTYAWQYRQISDRIAVFKCLSGAGRTNQ